MRTRIWVRVRSLWERTGRPVAYREEGAGGPAAEARGCAIFCPHCGQEAARVEYHPKAPVVDQGRDVLVTVVTEGEVVPV